MADISMCEQHECSLKESCYRYTATPNKHRQSYSHFAEKNGDCAYFWDNKGYENRIQISLVPNITNICYGRGVGYKIEEIVLDEKTQQISATKIREQMRKDGKL